MVKKFVKIVILAGFVSIMAVGTDTVNMGSIFGIMPVEVQAAQREYEPTIFMRRLPRGNTFSQGHTITRDRFLRTYGNPNLFHFEGRMYTSAEFFDNYNGQGFRWEINSNNQQGVRAHDVTLVVGHIAAPRLVRNNNNGATANVSTPATSAPENNQEQGNTAQNTPVTDWREGDAILFGGSILLNNEELAMLAEIAPSAENTRSDMIFTNRRLTNIEIDTWIEEYQGLGGINSFELEVIKAINEVRTEYGLTPLLLNPELSLAARFHSQEMTDLNFFSHQSHIYGRPIDRANIFGHSNAQEGFYGIGENLFRGLATPGGVVRSWMNSPGHRSMILNSDATSIGIGGVGRLTTAKFGF